MLEVPEELLLCFNVKSLSFAGNDCKRQLTFTVRVRVSTEGTPNMILLHYLSLFWWKPQSTCQCYSFELFEPTIALSNKTSQLQYPLIQNQTHTSSSYDCRLSTFVSMKVICYVWVFTNIDQSAERLRLQFSNSQTKLNLTLFGNGINLTLR